ncbi:uncharacterized protein N7484_009087 [Penicillium longicatenatum]|uniref:uncharacterized protein n=1 Tax=Penicillium longicatenatum TaxID=1561947 RepID=UPI0025492CE4|nr:uncharacterized protein N7484_009087 [Penicillium longicatenatum]KAJ5635774.1 hypothetical protein N7484_009087 [Penicillium longicatenatum]
MSSQPTYTEAQLEAYLKRIGYPDTKGTVLEEVREKIKADSLATLSDLQRRHLCAIPWGNSGLHYSQHHTISLHPETLFEKIVERRLDGYCMENSGVFFVVLRSLGFHVYATGGRVSRAAATGVDDGRYMSFGHMILIVVINGEKYMVDVGFGNNCATAPLPLREGATATHIGTSEMRLIRDSLVEFIDKEQKVWIYQTRYNPTSVWVPNICFSDVEFLPQDFAMINFSVSQKRTSWFGQVFVCMRMIMDQSEAQIIGQYVMSGKEVKKRVLGQTEILQVLHNEEDRVKALAKYFGMSLRQSEIQGIQGLTSEIR